MSASEHILGVRTVDQIAEIAVYDGHLNVVAKGVGALDEKLPAGLYRVRIRVGSVTDEKLAALDHDQTIEFGSVPFSSPIPLQNTEKTHEYHMDAARAASQTPQETLGAGASIMIFAREWSLEGNRSEGNPAEGLSLLDSKENLLAEVWKDADLRNNKDASAGWRADADPGGYLLRLELNDTDRTVLLRPIYVSPGTQTQIFCLVHEHFVEKGKTTRRADLANAAIVVSLDGSFNPDDRRARLSELACYALTQSRQMLPQSLIDDLISAKFDDPMLGLFGAYLLLRDRPDDKGVFRTVTDNLLRMLGPDHPDLRALWWKRDDDSLIGDGRLHVLPMLRASWDLAVERSVMDIDVISFGTFYSKLSRIVPSVPWLMLMDNEWASSDNAISDFTNARTRAYLSRVQAELTRKAEALQKQYFRRAATAVRDILPRGVASYLPSTWTTDVAVVSPAQSTAPALKDDEKADLARTLGVPADLLETILERKGH